jgi:hypothetical protein
MAFVARAEQAFLRVDSEPKRPDACIGERETGLNGPNLSRRRTAIKDRYDSLLWNGSS